MLLVDGGLGLGDAGLGGLAVLVGELPARPARVASAWVTPARAVYLEGAGGLELVQAGDGRLQPGLQLGDVGRVRVLALSRLAWAWTTACRAFSRSKGVTLRSLSRLAWAWSRWPGRRPGRRRGRGGLHDAVVGAWALEKASWRRRTSQSEGPVLRALSGSLRAIWRSIWAWVTTSSAAAGRVSWA